MPNMLSQSLVWLDRLEHRSRRPVAPTTMRAYRSLVNNWIVPTMGACELSAVTNRVLRDMVAAMRDKHLSPVTIQSAVFVARQIVASDIDPETGEQKVKLAFNPDFVELPLIDKRRQKAPTVASAALETAISRALFAGSQSGILWAVLAATGLRISEAMAVRVGLMESEKTFWDPGDRIIRVQSQIHEGQERGPKSASGFRDIDLTGEFNTWLLEQTLRLDIKPRQKLFQISIDRAKHDLAAAGFEGFHTFRRFRATHLRAMRAQEDIIRYWMGHASNQVTDRYAKLSERLDVRRDEVERVGLGFTPWRSQ